MPIRFHLFLSGLALGSLLVCTSLRASAAEDFYEVEEGDEPDHLVPIDSRPDDYDRLVEKRLFLTGAPYGRFVMLPAFEGELTLAVWARGDADDRHPKTPVKFFLTVTDASENLFYSVPENNNEGIAKDVTITREDREISRELAVAIQRVWGKMLHLTRYPTTSSVGVDGVVFQFSAYVRGLGEVRGMTWMPQKGLPHELVEIAVELVGFARSPGEKEEPMLDRLREFEARIPDP